MSADSLWVPTDFVTQVRSLHIIIWVELHLPAYDDVPKARPHIDHMSRIAVDNVAAAIRKVRSMSATEKEALADEIYLRQPHLLASCLVQSKLGVAPSAVEFLLNLLLVCYQAMKESGLQWPLITEEEQERQMQRWIGAVKFSEHEIGSATDSARKQYASQHPEPPLLAFVVSETNRWLRGISGRYAEAQSDKFVMMASMNLVNCIAGAPVSSASHG